VKTNSLSIGNNVIKISKRSSGHKPKDYDLESINNTLQVEVTTMR